MRHWENAPMRRININMAAVAIKFCDEKLLWPLARFRHPQYVGFAIIMFGFLLQWPTILTVIMFPVLVFMYMRLARGEEKDAQKKFGKVWDAYVEKTPAFFTRLKSKTP